MSDNENEEEQEPKNILSNEIIHKNLSQIKRTIEGNGFAFTSLNLKEKELEDLGAELFK